MVSSLFFGMQNALHEVRLSVTVIKALHPIQLYFVLFALFALLLVALLRLCDRLTFMRLCVSIVQTRLFRASGFACALFFIGGLEAASFAHSFEYVGDSCVCKIVINARRSDHIRDIFACDFFGDVKVPCVNLYNVNVFFAEVVANVVDALSTCANVFLLVVKPFNSIVLYDCFTCGDSCCFHCFL